MKYRISLTLLILSLILISCNRSSIPDDPNQVTQKSVKQKRFFSDNSFWNQLISANPEIDERSEKWIKMLEQEPTGENFGLTFNKWTIPVYEADENAKLVEVKHHYLKEREKDIWVTVKDRDRFGHGPDFSPVPIPDGAKPDPEEDAHFCVVDWNRMLAWDMWGLRQLEDSSWESNTGMMYRLDGDGVFDAFELGFVDGESAHFHGPSRAAGVPVIAGLVLYDEVMTGEIRHKLSFASRYAGYREYCYPASWTDGGVEGGIPEGAVMQLDPELDLTPFMLTPEETVIAKALQKYGMVLVDAAHGQPIFVEGLWGKPDKSWDGKLREWDGGMTDIPYKHYRVLKVKNPVYKGDNRKKVNN